MGNTLLNTEDCEEKRGDLENVIQKSQSWNNGTCFTNVFLHIFLISLELPRRC